MYEGLLHTHNFMRWVILLMLLIAIVRHGSGMSSKRMVNATDAKTDLFLMIAAHLTLVIGLYQWITGPWGLKLIQKIGFKEVMGNSQFRFWAVEHMLGMLIAIVLITIGRGAVKRSTNWQVHKKAFWLFLIALIIIIAVVPWPFRSGIGRPWFPGM
jgi:hypothetical protein